VAVGLICTHAPITLALNASLAKLLAPTARASPFP
jgi:hypothetical protein